MADPKPGVVIMPPGMIAASIRQEVDRIVNQLPAAFPQATMVRLDIGLDKGVNLAFAHKTYDGRFSIVTGGWIGKDWQGPVTGGVGVTVVF